MFIPPVLQQECLKYSNMLVSMLAKILTKIDYEFILFSGGIDSTLLSVISVEHHGKDLVLMTGYYTGANPQASAYAEKSASAIKAKHRFLYFTLDEFLKVLPDVIIALKSYHPVEVIDTAIIYLVVKKIVDREGPASFITGDGGDELFYGYNYMIGMTPQELEEHSRLIVNSNIYPAFVIPRIIPEAKVHAPILSDEIKKWSFDIPHFVKINTYNERIYGKFLLRLWLHEKLKDESLAWSPKRPIREESGNPADDISKLITIEDAIRLMQRHNVILRSLQHAYLFKIFIDVGLDVPGIQLGNPNACPHCGSPIRGELRRCMVCGWWENLHGYYPYR